MRQSIMCGSCCDQLTLNVGCRHTDPYENASGIVSAAARRSTPRMCIYCVGLRRHRDCHCPVFSFCGPVCVSCVIRSEGGVCLSQCLPPSACFSLQFSWRLLLWRNGALFLISARSHRLSMDPNGNVISLAWPADA